MVMPELRRGMRGWLRSRAMGIARCKGPDLRANSHARMQRVIYEQTSEG